MKLNEAVLMVARKLKNAFEIGAEKGDFIIADSEIALTEDYFAGEWIAITGSRLNDGIYRIDEVVKAGTYRLGNGTDEDETVVNEPFTGVVWRLNLRRDFLALCKDISEWLESDAGQPSAVVSESVVGFYSAKYATKTNGMPVSWENVFSSRINGSWRNMFESTLLKSL